MISKLTKGINISVETFYQPENSNPLNSEFMFAYRITIQNNNGFSVRLLRRHWFILEANATRREVEGEGVVGAQPLIESGKQYQYVSGCNLKTEMGKMYGTYLMENSLTKRKFEVTIPVFEMIFPYKLN